MKSKTVEYLSQLQKIKKQIEHKQDQIDELYAIAESVTARYEGERVQSSGNTDNIGTAVSEITGIQKDIDKDLTVLINKQREIIKIIEAVNPVELYEVLYLRYVSGDKWEDIAEQMNYSVDHVKGYLHGRAVAEVGRILTLINTF